MMDKELQKQIASIMNDFIHAIGAAKDFAIGQAPDVIQQYLLWGMVSNISRIVVVIIILFFSYKITFKWTDQQICNDEWCVSKIIASIICGSFSAITVVWGAHAIFALLQILVAPKIYLISAAASLVR